MNYIWSLKDLEKVKKNGVKVFSCFSCGGGSSMGYKLAGCEVIGNNEIDPKINAMYVANFSPRYNYCMPIDEMLTKDYPDEMMDLDILDGSPPCSTFSLAGLREKTWGKMKKFREGQEVQVLSDLFFSFAELVNKLQPKIFIAENVKGLITGRAKGYVNLILKAFDAAGYKMQIFLLNAATMGVPQRRERVFIIGRRKDLDYPELKLEFNEKPIKYGEFASEPGKPLNPEGQTFRRWQRRRPEDHNMGDTVARTEAGKVSGFTRPYIKLDEVSPTLTSGGEFMRFDVPAMPTERDLKIIQTFPLDYNFCGNNVQYVCGMSVPPIMMAHIAKEVYGQWLGK